MEEESEMKAVVFRFFEFLSGEYASCVNKIDPNIRDL